MRFGSVEALALAVIVIAIVGLIAWLARWQSRARTEFAGGQASTWRSQAQGLPTLLLILAAVAIVIAAARPQWGSTEQRREIQGIDLVIALDISLSMQGTDASPTRLRLAQDELVRLIESMRGNRIGIVFFAGTSIVRSPLSTDTQALTEIIRRAETELGLVRTGSDLGAALEQAGRILDASDSPGKAVLLVSDGEDHVGQAASKAAELFERGIVVFSAGVGTAQGSTLQERSLAGDLRTRLDASGQPIITRLDERTLQAVGAVGGGRYVHLNAPNRLMTLREDLLRLEHTPSGEQAQRLPIERFQYFAGLAFVLLALAWLVPARLSLPVLPWLGRTAARPGFAMFLLALLIGAGCARVDQLRAANEAANRLYDAGDYRAALDAYQRLLAQRPDVDELSYNVGNTLHRLGSFERAVEETRRALPPSTALLGSKTYYALGNHFLALDRLVDAFEAYRNALILNPKDRDAKHNLEYVLLRLNQLDQPPQPGDPLAGPPQPGNGDAEGDPQAGEGDQPPGDNGQPQGDAPGAQPNNNGQVSPLEAQRALAEALAGLDDEITPEDAIRILDLLRQQRQTQQPGRQAPGGGPDY